RCFWSARRFEGLTIELNWPADKLHRLATVGGTDLEQHVIGERLFVGREIEQTLDRRPLAGIGFQMLTPIFEGLCSESLHDTGACGLPVLHECAGFREARVVRQFGSADMFEEASDMGAGLERAQVDCAAVRRAEIAQ